MISEGLPERVQLEKVCGAGKEFRGIIPFLRLDRVKPLLADQDGAVSVELSFFGGGGAPLRIRGRLTGVFPLRCQRCLEPMQLPFDLDLRLVAVREDNPDQPWIDEADPLVVDDPLLIVHLLPLVEDELLLALPDYPRHDPTVCLVDMTQFKGEKEKPFQLLRQLKETFR